MRILTKSKQILKSAALGGATLALVAAPVGAYAHGGGGGDRDRGDNNKSRSSQAQAYRGGSDNKRGDSDKRHDSRQNNWWQKDRENKRKTCEERQQSLNQRAASTLDRHTKQLNGLNIVYSGIQTYVASGEVAVENYDALNAAATNSQTNATAAVNAIAAPQLNCDEQDQNRSNGENDNANATLNASIKASKDALNAYRHDVMRLFHEAIDS